MRYARQDSPQCIVHSPQLRITDYAHTVGDFSTSLEMTGLCAQSVEIIHSRKE
ncbi:MAG: hypothetical protein LBL66_07150 [Clostridiales bacterium]|nr:hypothetical protein [Clostridiales bacterium]